LESNSKNGLAASSGGETISYYYVPPGVFVGVGVLVDVGVAVKVAVAGVARVGVIVEVEVAVDVVVVDVGEGVRVEVAVTPPTEALKIIGAIHKARSPTGEPVERMVKINLISWLTSGDRSISAL
jgi:hypothetical protein